MSRIALFALALFVVPPPALSADLPRAQNPKECGQVGDLVWSARALHVNGVDREKSWAVLVDMYVGVFGPPERAGAYIGAAMRFAASELADKAPHPGVLGQYAQRMCHENRGDLTPLFGLSL
jgi:hypothetical protein